jgi:hypothetical protein
MPTKTFACPSCETRLKVAADLVTGRRIRCPKCDSGFPLPEDCKPARKAKKPAGMMGLVLGLVVCLILVGAGVTIGVFWWNSPKPPDSSPTNNPVRPDNMAGGTVEVEPGPFFAGRKVYASRGCVRCHTIGSVPAAPRGVPRRVDLSHVGAAPAHTAEWIRAYIRDPKSHNPEAKMPAQNERRLPAEDLRAVAEYLASLK